MRGFSLEIQRIFRAKRREMESAPVFLINALELLHVHAKSLCLMIEESISGPQ